MPATQERDRGVDLDPPPHDTAPSDEAAEHLMHHPPE